MKTLMVLLGLKKKRMRTTKTTLFVRFMISAVIAVLTASPSLALPSACNDQNCVEECNFRLNVGARMGPVPMPYSEVMQIKTVFQRSSNTEDTIRVMIRSRGLGNWDGVSSYDPQTYQTRSYQFTYLQGQDERMSVMQGHRYSQIIFDASGRAAQVQSAVIDPTSNRDLYAAFDQAFSNSSASGRWDQFVQAAASTAPVVTTQLSVNNVESAAIVDSGALNFYWLRVGIEHLDEIARFQIMGEPTPGDAARPQALPANLVRRLSQAFETPERREERGRVYYRMRGHTRFGTFVPQITADVFLARNENEQNSFRRLQLEFPARLRTEDGRPGQEVTVVLSMPDEAARSQQCVMRSR